MEKENTIKIISGPLALCLVLAIVFCLKINKEKLNIQKEFTALQKEKENLEKRVAELKEKIRNGNSVEEVLTPLEVVKRFIEADMAGARLGGEISRKAPSIDKYLSVDFSYEGEPIMVIKGYKIIKILDDLIPSAERNFAYVEVKFFCDKGISIGVIGSPVFKSETVLKELEGSGAIVSFDCDDFHPSLSENDPSVKYDPETNTETIIFGLRKECGQWKIYSPSICPRISEETFKKFLKVSKK